MRLRNISIEQLGLAPASSALKPARSKLTRESSLNPSKRQNGLRSVGLGSQQLKALEIRDLNQLKVSFQKEIKSPPSLSQALVQEERPSLDQLLAQVSNNLLHLHASHEDIDREGAFILLSSR